MNNDKKSSPKMSLDLSRLIEQDQGKVDKKKPSSARIEGSPSLDKIGHRRRASCSGAIEPNVSLSTAKFSPKAGTDASRQRSNSYMPYFAALKTMSPRKIDQFQISLSQGDNVVNEANLVSPRQKTKVGKSPLSPRTPAASSSTVTTQAGSSNNQSKSKGKSRRLRRRKKNK